MSRVNFGAKPVMYPMPVLIIATYDENGVPDAIDRKSTRLNSSHRL